MQFHRTSRRFIAVLILMTCALSLCAPICARAETNLAKNGDLSAGSGNAPNHWYALSSDKKLTTFSWTKTPGDGGVLAINNLNHNIASWHQALILPPGLYEISAEVRVEGAQPRGSGANIAVLTYDGIRLISKHLHGTSDWQKISFLLREDRWGDTTELLCQLGIDGYPETGAASFRNIKVLAIASSPRPRAFGYDLHAIREHYKAELLQPGGPGYLRAVAITSGLTMPALPRRPLFLISRPPISPPR